MYKYTHTIDMKCSWAYKEKKLEMCAEQVNGLSKLMNLAHHWMERLKWKRL